jgi:hypothetical protein
MSGQAFTDLLAWHPRDVDTLEQIYHDRVQAADDEAREARFAAGTAQVFENMKGRR